jgi:uncharacterized 2Fe-2S/4Fe-4S cluster protein (DUF4445 family)
MKPLVIQVSFEDGPPRVIQAQAQAGDSLLELLRENGVPMDARCGGRGLCERCRVTLVSGSLESDAGSVVIGQEIASCLCRVRAPQEPFGLKVPKRSLVHEKTEVVADFRLPGGKNLPLLSEGAQRPKSTALAIDIGTTTVAALLLDTESGAVLSRASALNAQVAYGEDVLTRIQFGGSSAENLSKIQHAITTETLVPVLRRALGDSQGPPPKEVVIAGNTTMLHLLCGVDPTPLGFSPFTPHFLDQRTESVASLGLGACGLPGETPCRLLPGFSTYVGADITAGVIASGLEGDDGPSLLVDAGTNGEIVFKHGDRYLACATAAGPAFEGRGLCSGMRAARGAIDAVRFHAHEPNFRYSVVGGDQVEPAGLCGSAYVDFLAEGKRCGLLDGRAKFVPEVFNRFPASQREQTVHGRMMILSERAMISELDLASLLQAKGAVAAGILILLKTAGVSPSEVKRLYLAGGFGFHLRLRNAIACGLLPGFTEGQVEVIGNSSLGGAYLAARDPSVVGRIDGIRKRTEIVELNLDPEFEDTYLDQLGLE